jgi:hypothetical protein
MANELIYTDKLLGENFRIIQESFNLTAEALRAMDSHVSHLEGHLVALTKKQAELASRMPKKHRVLPFVAGAAIGVYVYQKLKKNIEFYPSRDAARQKPEPATEYAETTVRPAEPSQD